MEYQFRIQVSAPRISEQTAELQQAASLSDVIEAVYLSDTERAYLCWNWISVPLCYKYDLSVLIDDLLPMLDAILASDVGAYDVMWPSDTFRATWQLRWDEERVHVRAHWDSVVGGKMIESALNSRHTLEMSKRSYLGEWASLLESVLANLATQFIPSPAAEEFQQASSLLASIPFRGSLYQ